MNPRIQRLTAFLTGVIIFFLAKAIGIAGLLVQLLTAIGVMILIWGGFQFWGRAKR